MSQSKFDAAKELIQEKKYDAARAILQTMNHPTAEKWLAKLDEIDPPFPAPPPMRQQVVSAEQEHFYRRENKNARFRRTVSGLELVGLGVFCFAAYLFFAATAPTTVQNGIVRHDLGFSWLFIVLGLLAILGGFRKLSKRD